MKSLSHVIIARRRLIVALFLVITVICSLLMLTVSINYTITDYLPKQAQSTKALKTMEQEFTASVPNLRVMLRDISLPQALQAKQRFSSLPGVSQVLWLDDMADVKIPLEMLDSTLAERYYRDGSALFELSIRKGVEAQTVDEIYQMIGEENAAAGDAMNTAMSQLVARTELVKAMLILVPLIVIILLLSTSSWIEPLLFLLTIGVAVLINLGTNILFGEISFIAQAISPILQLAVSLDYAIFLLHSFAKCRTQTDNLEQAMRQAMRQSFSAIAASAATTFFGFLALIFMDFLLGVDLGLNLIKGILLSFLSVMVFLPALTLCFYKLIDKTHHRLIMPRFSGIGKLVSKVRIPCLIVVLLVLVPCFLAQSRNHFTYGMGDFSPASRSGQDTIAIDEAFGKSTAVVLLVPRGDPAREAALVARLEEMEHVTSSLSYVSAVGAAIPDGYLDREISEQFYSEKYSRIILYTDTDQEGATAFDLVERIQREARAFYGDEALSMGQSVNLYDMKNTVTADNRLVNLIAIIAIGLVLLLTFRSLTLPLVLLLTIEAAIWINLSINWFSGSTLNYIGYLVINTVQLGATVDYAILLTVNYTRSRKLQPIRPALVTTLSESFPAILTSASILAAAGFCLYATSSNPIVSELGLLLGRGTLLSFSLVVFLLPALLWLLDRVIEKTTLRAGFYRERSDR